MDNRQEDASIGHTHEPNEITVQLDGRGRKLAGELGEQAADPAAEPADEQASDGPVFVDASGRRSKKLRKVGWVLALACACYAATLVAALIGGSSTAPWLPGIGLSDKEKSESVEIQPAPTDRPPVVTAPDDTSGTPGAPVPTDSTGAVLPQPSAGASGGLPAAPGTGASGSASPKPPSGGGAGDPDPGVPPPPPPPAEESGEPAPEPEAESSESPLPPGPTTAAPSDPAAAQEGIS